MTQDQSFDPLATYNRQRWNELAAAGTEFSRPLLELDPAAARHFLDPHGIMGDVAGRRVLCLAASGGQQTVAFALLGAHTTVFDLSDVMLQRDRAAAAHYKVEIDIQQGDMRDLGRFANDAFDIVYQAYSINFVPHIHPVLKEVARILRPKGLYRIEWHNPFTQTIDDTSWNGQGYLLATTYQDGREVSELFPDWDVTAADGTVRRVRGPRSFVHGLGQMINTLAALGFVLLHCSEHTGAGADATPGSWEHFMAVTAPWLTLWATYRPDVLSV